MGRSIAFIVIPLVVALLFISSGFGIKLLGKIPFYWIEISGQAFAIIVTGDQKEGEMTKGGGNVVNLLHAIPGHFVDKTSANEMDWEIKKGDEPEHHTLAYRRLGVQKMGSIYYTVRSNVDRRLRFTRKSGQDSYQVQPSDDTIKFVPFSGELSVVIEESDTADGLAIDLEFDFIFERVFPIRSVLRLADSPAFLTSMIEQLVNNATSVRPSMDYLGGPESGKLKQQLADDAEKVIADPALKEIGLRITKGTLRSVTMRPEYRSILQQQVEAEKAAAAALIKAENDRKIRMMQNDTDADRVERVTIPSSTNPLRVAARFAEALEKNEHLTSITYAPGKDSFVNLGK